MSSLAQEFYECLSQLNHQSKGDPRWFTAYLLRWKYNASENAVAAAFESTLTAKQRIPWKSLGQCRSRTCWRLRLQSSGWDRLMAVWPWAEKLWAQAEEAGTWTHEAETVLMEGQEFAWQRCNPWRWNGDALLASQKWHFFDVYWKLYHVYGWFIITIWFLFLWLYNGF